MSDTTNLGLPLVQASQAQKHVTVNEALALLDGLCQPVFGSVTQTQPPTGPEDGAIYGVPEAASGAWQGQQGKLAIFSNGGWRFVSPRAGWQGWVADQGAAARHDGAGWQVGAAAVSPGGASSVIEVLEFDHDLAPGTTNQTTAAIPANTMVFGVTGRIVATLTGSVSTWQLGVSGGANRYGSGLGTGTGAWVMGLTGQPLAYYSATPLLLSAQGGSFSGGRVRLAVHLYRMTLPR